MLVGAPWSLSAFGRALRGRPLMVKTELLEQLRARRRRLEELLARERIYGVNTGVGARKDERIPEDALEAFQRELLRSHAGSAAPPLPYLESRAIFLAQILQVSHPATALRPETLLYLIELFNQGAAPVYPSEGSVGASGDLIPLAHGALALMGEGELWWNGARRKSDANWEPAPKEALTLINGTAFSAGLLALACLRARDLWRTALRVGALSTEVLMGSVRPFQEEFARLKRHPGIQRAARLLGRWTQDSPLVASHAGCGRLQDAYALRALPNVMGAVEDAWRWVEEVCVREINSFADNPAILEAPHYGAHFHGEHLLLASHLARAATLELLRFSRRRIARLLDPHFNEGLPPFLAEKGTGYMLTEYWTAALFSRASFYAGLPSLVDASTSAGQEDFNSFCATSVLGLLEVLDLARRVVTVEALLAVVARRQRALDSAPGTRALEERLSAVLPWKPQEPLEAVLRRAEGALWSFPWSA